MAKLDNFLKEKTKQKPNKKTTEMSKLICEETSKSEEKDDAKNTNYMDDNNLIEK